MRAEKISVFLIVLCIGFASAGFFSDVFGGVTGRVIDNKVLADSGVDVSDIGCVDAKVIFDDKYVGFMTPEEIPFRDEVFEVYIDDVFFASFELINRSLSKMSCEVLDSVSYRVYVKGKVIDNLVSGEMGGDPVKFYNEKKKNEEIKIKAVGFGKKFKLSLLNIGMKIAGWFS